MVPQLSQPIPSIDAFMNYPEDIARLGLKYYRHYVDGDGPGQSKPCT
jgi:hypothetical protein